MEIYDCLCLYRTTDAHMMSLAAASHMIRGYLIFEKVWLPQVPLGQLCNISLDNTFKKNYWDIVYDTVMLKADSDSIWIQNCRYSTICKFRKFVSLTNVYTGCKHRSATSLVHLCTRPYSISYFIINLV